MSLLVDLFISWATKRPFAIHKVYTFDDRELFRRYEFMRLDEWPDDWWDKNKEEYPRRPNELPWWLPVNAFLHRWNVAEDMAEEFHDHPRWSVTICLKGELIERTPWGEQLLRPGSIVVRSRKAIHAFRAPAEFRGEAWTLFIVGPRRHRQNVFVVAAH